MGYPLIENGAKKFGVM